VNICESQIKKSFLFYWIFWLKFAQLHHWGHTNTYKSNLFKATHEFTKNKWRPSILYKIQFEIENKMLTTKINWLILKDGLFFLYSYQVLIRVKVVICIWADTISHYHALAKDISYYKWYVRPVFFETATYIKNVTKGRSR
jgi:hypothetical protein